MNGYVNDGYMYVKRAYVPYSTIQYHTLHLFMQCAFYFLPFVICHVPFVSVLVLLARMSQGLTLRLTISQKGPNGVGCTERGTGAVLVLYNCGKLAFTLRYYGDILLPIPKNFIIPHKRHPVPHIIPLHLLHCLLAPLLPQLNRLNHRLYPLLARQLQHLQTLLPAPDMTAPNLAPVRREVKPLQLRQRLVRQSHVVELAVDFERREVFRQVELVRHVRRVEDQVEFKRQRLGPIFGPRVHEMVGPQLARVGFFRLRVAQGVDFGAEGVCEEEGKVTEAADADDGDAFAGADVSAYEGRKGREARAHHGAGGFGGDVGWDGEDEVFVRADVRAVAALGGDFSGGFVGVLSAISVCLRLVAGGLEDRRCGI